MQSMSVSFGARAFPEVHRAIKHAAMFPDHDPFVIFNVDYEYGTQEAIFRCHECGSQTITLSPETLAVQAEQRSHSWHDEISE